MSKSVLREDKTCLNCFHVVEKRFCPNCGQENIETRKTFYHLFVHFFEDLTHYENAFWKTIRNLIFRPASLTKEYLSGRRMSYLAPFRLYIFISFVTFFFVAVAPQSADSVTLKNKDVVRFDNDSIATNKDENDSEQMLREGFGFGTLRELDSIQKFAPEADRLNGFQYWIAKKAIPVTEHNTSDEIIQEFKESFIRNLPKVLFVYLPIFAFVLWIFQSKKRWYYFDHGIFTLHYFSFLLLLYLVIAIVNSILFLFGANWATNTISGLFQFVCIVWMLYYFFPAHHRFYEETRIMSIIKGSVMFFINLFFIILILLLFAVYTFINIH